MELGDELAGKPLTAKRQEQIRSAWLNVAFSEHSNALLHRYFRYHYQRARSLGEAAAGLTGFLETYFPDFLEELPPAAAEQPVGKLAVDLSVAQLACLLRLLYDEGVYPATGISELLRFTAAHHQSKRREQISAGSLNKEYYGTTQVTAATCRDLLERLIKRLNKHFFP